MRLSPLVLVLLLAGCAGLTQDRGRWYSAWATAHNARETTPPMSGRTVRMILTPTVAGDAVRVKLENTMGEGYAVFSGAFLAVAGEGAAVRPGTTVRLTFDREPSLALSPGQGAYSDPVPFAVRPFQQLALSLEVQSASDISVHHVGLRNNWSAPGARGAEPSAAGFEPLPEAGQPQTGQWPFYWVAALDVRSSEAKGSVVFLADSITDGRCSTRDEQGVTRPNLDQRWGDVLARRLAARGTQLGFANAGIAGNRVLNRGNGPSALERYQRDVLDRAGVTHVVFFEGTNDVSAGFTAPQIIEGMQKIVGELKARGLKVIGATAIPRGSATVGPKWTSAMERERVALNAWLRSPAARLDGLLDFDALMQGARGTLADGTSVPVIPAAWNCDGVHPNAAGYKAMGESVDLKLFD